jgi:hypothetical protein
LGDPVFRAVLPLGQGLVIGWEVFECADFALRRGKFTLGAAGVFRGAAFVLRFDTSMVDALGRTIAV